MFLSVTALDARSSPCRSGVLLHSGTDVDHSGRPAAGRQSQICFSGKRCTVKQRWTENLLLQSNGNCPESRLLDSYQRRHEKHSLTWTRTRLVQ
ncbi:hypothetical protein CHARACLAT_013534 [Characodon lateralis]|uniref:MHC class I antigen n=1 Tax=Characodon lateralis TaxID=208331 RepID=A0ABU7D6E6_9TELE|nr:hypothetical protein [Characodon lateralis]